MSEFEGSISSNGDCSFVWRYSIFKRLRDLGYFTMVRGRTLWEALVALVVRLGLRWRF